MERSFKMLSGLKEYRAMSPEDKKRRRREFLIDNSLYIFLIAAIIAIEIVNPKFLSLPSVVAMASPRPLPPCLELRDA